MGAFAVATTALSVSVRLAAGNPADKHERPQCDQSGKDQQTKGYACTFGAVIDVDKTKSEEREREDGTHRGVGRKAI
jgi:hypothetical protein